MNRARFTEGFKERMRFVAQKIERLAKANQVLEKHGHNWGSQEAYDEAHINLEAAIDLFADHVFDGIEMTGPAQLPARDERTPRTTPLL